MPCRPIAVGHSKRRVATPNGMPCLHLLPQEDVTLEGLRGEPADELRLPDAAVGEAVRAAFTLQNHSDTKHFRWAPGLACWPAGARCVHAAWLHSLITARTPQGRCITTTQACPMMML